MTRILVGDALSRLRELPNESVGLHHCRPAIWADVFEVGSMGVGLGTHPRKEMQNRPAACGCSGR